MNLQFSEIIFIGFLLLLALQRVLEMRLSVKNEAALRAEGAREYGAGHFPFMKLLHSLWFFAMLIEVFLLKREFVLEVALFVFPLFLVGQTLRYLAIKTLKGRWTVRIMILPEKPPVSGGVYRIIRHPNYVGVILELAVVPLLHGAWITALVFSILNAILLFVRIRAEEAALEEQNNYKEILGDTPAFIPLSGKKREN